jgi:galactose mutarotase-like enzyme
VYIVSSEQKQYHTYTLSDSLANSQLEIVPERGGIATSWRIHNNEVFYLDTDRFASPELSVRGGNPILFPLCGNLPNNIYSVDGKEYHIKQHGFARELPWTVIEQSLERAASLTLELRSSSQTKEVYPFDFCITFTYLLRGNCLEIRQRYQNLSAVTMPFYSGFHPYFLCGDKSRLEVEIPSDRYEDNRTKQSLEFTGKFDFEQDEIDAVFGNLTQRSTSVTDRSRNLKIVIAYDDFYSCLVFWTVKGKDFYCLEPWSAGRNAFNTGENLTVLSPHSQCEAVMTITADFHSQNE